MSVSREGGCACGQARYRLTSDPLFVHCCHCLNCQRQTGSAFVINLLIETDRVELFAGEPQPVSVPREREAEDLALPDVPDCGLQSVHERQGAVRSRRHARRPDLGRARRPHLHAVEAPLGHAPGVGAGVQHVLRHEEAVAGPKPRASRSAQTMSHEDYRRTSYETWEAMAPGWERWRAALEDALGGGSGGRRRGPTRGEG